MWRPDRYIRRNSSGLTLVEILVVAVIFSILVTSLFTVFRGGLDSWHKAETILDMYQNARFALDIMEREIASACLYQESSNTAYWTKFEGYRYPSVSGLKTGSAGDEIFFVAPIANNSAKQDLCEAGYWLRNDNRLMHHFEYFDGSVVPVAYDFSKKADGSADTGASDTTVARNVTALQFTYYYRHAAAAAPDFDTPALHTWNSGSDNPGGRAENYDSDGNAKNPDGLPDAVEISITLQSKDGSQTKTFTDFIRIVGAR
ncbi:MAG: prepilin-type N-terminal cleavage/methylation domain-containing protein [Candidatus Omnitrophica bacterium]|nr:prepilin-type N-terminal cleavage/methylation domain-containing protein [Candidatus Omnitrophota bacterium]MDD5545567.1 prepilin-type N-terminal cleavage/methylation domain-containing protein [Candidatus Omnitrophota bacterium]